MISKKIFLVVAFATIFGMQSQAESPVWNVNLPGKIDWIKINPSGILVTATKQGLAGIDPETREIAWIYEEIQNVKESSYKSMGLSPYFIVESDKDIGTSSQTNSSAETLVINAVTGQVLFRSKAAGFNKIEDVKPLHEKKALLIKGVGEEKQVIYSMVDIMTGEKTWQVPVGKTSLFTTASAVYNLSPRFVSTGEILLSNNGSLTVVNAETGEKLWDIEKNVQNMFLCNNEKTVVVMQAKGMMANKEEMTAYNVADGSIVWDEPVKTNGSYRYAIPREDDFIFVHYGGFNIYENSTGNQKIKKEVKTKEAVNDFKEFQKGYLLLAGSYMYYVDKNGDEFWKKPVQVAESEQKISYMKETPQGIFFISPSMANIIIPESGKKLAKKDLEFKEKPVIFFDEEENKYIVYADKSIVSIDPKEFKVTELQKKFKWEGKEEPVKFEKITGGYLLSSQQSVALIGFDGTVKYQQSFKAPDIGTIGKIGAGLLVTATSVTANGFGVGEYAYLMAHSKAGGVMEVLNIPYYSTEDLNSMGYAAMRKRYSATAETAEFMTILTNLETSNGKEVGLVKLNKMSGNVDDQFVFADKKPIYEIDNMLNILYFVDNNEIKVWQL
jgi:outer membrane protein assembly factor BamB